MGMGADRSKIHLLPMVSEQNGQERTFRLDKDLLKLRAKLDAFPNVRLVFFDPLSNYYGSKNGNNEQEVRSVLMPLSKLAQEYNVSIVTVMHNSKTQGRSAMHKTIGAVGNAGVARMGWTFVKDPQNADHKLMLQMKENLGKFTGIRYRTKPVKVIIKGKETEQAGVQYLGISEAQADNIVMQSEDFKEKSVQPAINLIKAHLTPGNVILAAVIVEQAGAQGISLGQLESARMKLGITKSKAGSGFSWIWPALVTGEEDHGDSESGTATA